MTVSRFFSAGLIETPRRGGGSFGASHALLTWASGKTPLPLPTAPDPGEGGGAGRRTEDGSRQGAEHRGLRVSAPPLRAAPPPPKHDNCAVQESRLFRREKPDCSVPVQHPARWADAKEGSLRRLPLLMCMGDHCPQACLMEAGRHLSCTSGGPCHCLPFRGWASSSGLGGPAAHLPPLSASLGADQLGLGSLNTGSATAGAVQALA